VQDMAFKITTPIPTRLKTNDLMVVGSPLMVQDFSIVAQSTGKIFSALNKLSSLDTGNALKI
jgi:hypothetical protein